MNYSRFLIVFMFVIGHPMTANAAPDGPLNNLIKGETKYAEVIAALGPPSKTEFNDEGLKAIAYLNQSIDLNAASVFSIAGSIASIFVPGAAGLATSGASLATETIAGGATGKSGISAFVFDKNGILMYFQSTSTTISSSSFKTSSDSKVVSSEDGAAPMPHVVVTLPDDQRLRKLDTSDKPRLGIQFMAISDLGDPYKDAFKAAKFNGVVVANVIDGSVSQQAGIKYGDYIYVLNGMLVKNASDIASAMSTVHAGDTIKARAKRIDANANLSIEHIFTLNFPK